MKILVIEAAGLHLGYVGCYGNDWVATPNLDRLAVEGVVFDWHFADQPELQFETPWQERSVGTGHYAFPGQAPHVTDLSLTPHVVRCQSLAQFAAEAMSALQENERWLWIEGPSLLPPWTLEDELLDAYFDEDDVEEGLAPWVNPPLNLVTLNEADVLQLQNTYAAAVTVFDAQLGELLGKISLDDTLLCVTACSGLPLGEHGMIGTPKPRLHDELVHVPLLLRLPGAEQAGLRVSALTQPVDLLPTFLEALGQPVPPLHGRSLWPVLRGITSAIRPFAVAALRCGPEECWLMRTPEWALHVPCASEPEAQARESASTLACASGSRSGKSVDMPQLFAKPDDRWEVNDLWQQQIETADAMAQTLRAFADAIRQPLI